MSLIRMIKCDYCDEYFDTIRLRDSHAIEEHDLYRNTDINITEQTISKLRNTMAKVKYLLERYPSTRGDDRILILQYIKLFERHLVYNENTGLIEFMNRQGISYEDWRMLTAFETITRARRKIQEQFSSLLPSNQTILKRRQKEIAYKTHMKKITYSKEDYDDLNAE